MHGLYEHAVALDGNEVGFLQPHAAINAAALVPPSLAFIGIDVHGESVFALEFCVVGNIDFETRVAAKIVLHKTAVEVHGRVHGDALEVQRKPLVLVGLIQREFLYIPSVIVRQKAPRGVVFFVGKPFDYIIVRKIDLYPLLALVFALGRVRVDGGEVVFCRGS